MNDTLTTEDAPWRFETGSFDAFAHEYSSEIKSIAETTRHPKFEHFIAKLSDYSQYMESRKCMSNTVLDITSEFSGKNIINITSNRSETIRNGLALANIVSACHLLHGTRININQLNHANLIQYATHFINTARGKPEDYIRNIINKFHTIDAIRIFHFLRAIGLITRPASKIHQIGFGAADGTRDIISIHLEPAINIQDTPDGKQVTLACSKQHAATTTIVDAEKIYSDHYAALNEDTSMNVVAHNIDTIDFLTNCDTSSKGKNNLITALRIDHRMLPDVKKFFSLLANWIDNQCDLVMTIGAGDTPNDFEGRINKFREICTVLSSAKLNPIIFKLYRSHGSYAKKQKSLYFGNIRASSYEILYCSLSKQALKSIE